MVLKKSFFKIGMWHSRPPLDPPVMANAILNFHFNFLHPSLTQICGKSAYISNQYDVWSSPEACCNVSFVSLARLRCVCTFIRRLFIGKLNMVEWQRIPTLVDFNQVVASPAARSTEQRPTGRRTLMEIYVANLWQANCSFFSAILFTRPVIWLGNH